MSVLSFREVMCFSCNTSGLAAQEPGVFMPPEPGVFRLLDSFSDFFVHNNNIFVYAFSCGLKH